MDTRVAQAAIGRAEMRHIMVGLGLAMLLSALDQTIVVTALPTIGADFHDFGRLSWIVTAYLVAATAVTPLYGKLADIHGRRVVLLAGIAIFLIGSVACALAPGMIALTAARAVQGAGGGGLISLSQTIIADLVTPRERGRYQTYFAAVFTTSSIAGPVLGGVFAEYASWPWIFWINLPLGAAAFVIVNRRLAALPWRGRPHRLDALGALLLVAAAALFVLALGQDAARHLATTAALLAASSVFWALFAWRAKTAEEPFIPLSVLANRVARHATLTGAFGLGSYIGLSVVLPVYFESGLGLAPDRSGLALIPMMIATVIGATLSGQVMAHVTHYKRAPLAALACAVAAAMFLGWRLADLSLLEMNALLTVVGLGVGAMLPISTVCVQNAVHGHDLGAATAVMQFSRQLGGALIVALLGALVFSGGSAEAAERLRAAGDLVTAFRLVFCAAAGCIALSFFFLARMEEKPLRGAHH